MIFKESFQDLNFLIKSKSDGDLGYMHGKYVEGFEKYKPIHYIYEKDNKKIYMLFSHKYLKMTDGETPKYIWITNDESKLKWDNIDERDKIIENIIKDPNFYDNASGFSNDDKDAYLYSPPINNIFNTQNILIGSSILILIGLSLYFILKSNKSIDEDED